MLKFLPKPFRRLRLTAADKKFYDDIKDILGFPPDNLDIYKLAIIHRSASLFLNKGQRVDNERLEYLGDAILDAIVADFLFAEFPNSNEGFLTKMRAKIVSRGNLNQLAVNLGIPRLVKVGNGVLVQQKYIYGNALEAIVGAMFIDKGFKFTSEVVVNNILGQHIDLIALQVTEHDYKSRVLEIAQKLRVTAKFDTHDYVSQTDTHAVPSFESVLLWNNIEVSRGIGQSKKEAEQQAAMAGIEFVEMELEKIGHEDIRNG